MGTAQYLCCLLKKIYAQTQKIPATCFGSGDHYNYVKIISLSVLRKGTRGSYGRCC